jgi:hypothetical protein
MFSRSLARSVLLSDLRNLLLLIFPSSSAKRDTHREKSIGTITFPSFDMTRAIKEGNKLQLRWWQFHIFPSEKSVCSSQISPSFSCFPMKAM